MSFAALATCLMTIGLLARYRALAMAEGTGYGTIARFEAERAVGFATLLIILTLPWFIIAAVILY